MTEKTRELNERILGMAKLSKGQRRISDYLLNHYDKAAFMTAEKLGEAANVSESTIVRFATALGYDGYPQLSQAIQEMVRNRLTAVQRISIAKSHGSAIEPSEIFKADMLNIRHLMENMDASAFESAKRALLGANRIYVLGLRSSSPLAQYFNYYLNYIFDGVRLVIQGGSEVREQLARIGDGDVLIGMSFPRYSNRAIESMRYAKSQGAVTIAITDSLSSPIAQPADICLIAKSSMATFVDSLVAPMSLINSLIVALASEKNEELSGFFGKLEQIWSDTAIYGGGQGAK